MALRAGCVALFANDIQKRRTVDGRVGIAVQIGLFVRIQTDGLRGHAVVGHVFQYGHAQTMAGTP